MLKILFQAIATCLLVIQSQGEVCYSPHCNETALDMLEYMDITVDPCQNFYSFTCGGFLKNFELPANELRVSAYQVLEDDLDNKLKGVLESPVNLEGPKFENITKSFYNSCMDEVSVENQGTSPILKLFEELGGWPIINDNWDESQSDLTSVFIKLTDLGFPHLFAMIVYVEEKNSTNQLPVLFQADTTFQNHDYADGLSGIKINYLRTFMTDMINLLTNNTLDTQKVTQDVEEMLTFEIELSQILVTPEEMRDNTQLLTTMENITKQFEKSVQFDVYIRGVFEAVNIDIPSDQLIEEYYPTYIQKLPKLLENTPRRIIINYMLWKVLIEFISALPTNLFNVKEQFAESVYGVAGSGPRYKRCLTVTNDMLSGAVGALYVKEHFKTSAKEKMLIMINELKRAFLDMLIDNLWMTEETKEMAREKAHAMKEKIGYPDEYLDPHFFEDVLGDAVMSADSFLENWSTLRKCNTKENLRHLQKKLSNSSFLMPVANVNSFYFPNLNSIEFPAGILQYPFFNEEMAMYQNFGGIGYVIGHEITHGFDDNGRKYNSDGNALIWWKEEDTMQFINMTQCFVDLYNSFIVKTINESVNGRLTLGENIADVGGLKESFLAYKSWARHFGIEPQLPGLPYSPEQMLFIHFGKINCMKARPEIELHLIRSDNHSPSEFRVNGALMNLKEFSEVFNCPVGSPMNPVDKCFIW